MLRLRKDQPSLWESVLPAELFQMSEELAKVDRILDDEHFFAPFKARFDTIQGRPTIPVATYLRLMYLKRRYGADLVTIAHLFASEAIRPGEPGTRAATGTIEARLADVPERYFLLDLHTAPSPVTSWLMTPHELFGIMPYNTTIPGEAYDAVFFSQQVGPAIPWADDPGGLEASK